MAMITERPDAIAGGMVQGCFANLPLPSRTAPNASLMVNRSLPRGGVNMELVNRGALELFPAMSLVKNSYIRREKWSAVP